MSAQSCVHVLTKETTPWGVFGPGNFSPRGIVFFCFQIATLPLRTPRGHFLRVLFFRPLRAFTEEMAVESSRTQDGGFFSDICFCGLWSDRVVEAATQNSKHILHLVGLVGCVVGIQGTCLRSVRPGHLVSPSFNRLWQQCNRWFPQVVCVQ